MMRRQFNAPIQNNEQLLKAYYLYTVDMTVHRRQYFASRNIDRIRVKIFRTTNGPTHTGHRFAVDHNNKLFFDGVLTDVEPFIPIVQLCEMVRNAVFEHVDTL